MLWRRETRLFGLQRTALLCLLIVTALPGVAQSGPAANGHWLLQQFELVRTQAYGIDDGHLILGAIEPEVSAIQFAIWETDLTATLVTVIGVDPSTDRRLLYRDIRGFAPGTAKISGENRLQMAGNTYFAQRAEMMTLGKLSQEFPQLRLNCLNPRSPDEEYAVVIWRDVVYANGAAIGAGYAIFDDNFFLDLFADPYRPDDRYKTMSVDCPCPADLHPFSLRDLETIVVATHHQQPTGTGRHNEILSIIGAAGPDPVRATMGMVGFPQESVELQGDSTILDADGDERISPPRLMTAEQIAAEYPQMDVSHLGGGGVYIVDYWPSVAMIASNMRGNSVANISGSVRVNGELVEFSGVSRETGAQPLGTLQLAGNLNVLQSSLMGQTTGLTTGLTTGQTTGLPSPLIADELLLPIDLIIAHPTGQLIDNPLLILTRAGDTANAIIEVGDPRSDIFGILREDVTVTSTDPWTVDVRFSGQIRIAGTYSLPASKQEMDFRVNAKRAEGSLLLSVERGTGQQPALIPVTYRIRYDSNPERALPTRFLQTVTFDTFDLGTGAFTGTIERSEVSP